jgi:colanic acid/amylovoran biosynthesis glycosyltransferase
MKIAFVMGYFPALSTTFITNQVTGLLAAGHDVEVFALRRGEESKVHPDVARYRLLERVTYFAIPQSRVRRACRAARLLALNFARGPALIARSLNALKYGREAISLNLFYYVIPFLGKEFDVIHAHTGPIGMIGCWLRELGVPGRLITTFYGADLSSFVKEKGPTYYQPLFAGADRLLPICRYFQGRLLELGCRQDKITVHPVGVDLEAFTGKRLARAPGAPFRILTVARLVEKKGIAYGLQAVAILAGRYGNIEYVVAGSGPLSGALQSLAERLRIADRVKFVGAVDRDEQLRLFAESDLFLLPSVTAEDGDEEGTPTVLLEAQAAGLPVVSSRTRKAGSSSPRGTFAAWPTRSPA